MNRLNTIACLGCLLGTLSFSGSAAAQTAGDYRLAEVTGIDGLTPALGATVRDHATWRGKFQLRLPGLERPLRGHTIPGNRLLFVFPAETDGLVGSLGGSASTTLTHATVVVQSRLNLRADASGSSAQLGTGRPGDTHRVVAREGSWAKLQVGDAQLWAHTDFLERTTGASTATELAGRRTWAPQQRADGSLSGPIRDGKTVIGSLRLVPKVPPRSRVSDGKVTFASIDLTYDLDSVDFNRRAKRFGMQNVLSLVPRGRDVAHPEMSLQAGVVSPYGAIREITSVSDEDGQEYTRDTSTFTTARAQRNIRFCRDWILQPGVTVSADGTRGQLVGAPSEGGVAVQGQTTFADFLFLSSHGYTDGEIRGAPRFSDSVTWNGMGERPTFTPFSAVLLKVTNLPNAQRWTNGRTRWAMLALCNVLRREYWQDWSAALLDAQGMRGVLGYGSGSPKPAGTTEINQRFFAACRRGLPIVDAWRAANEEARIFTWCAIVREDALGDKLSTWVRTGDLPARKASTRVLYFSAKSTERRGVPVATSADPTPTLQVRWTHQGRAVTKAEGSLGGGIVPGLDYRIELKGLPRPIRATDKVFVTFVNIREDYWRGNGRHELDLDAMFEFEPDVVDRHQQKTHQPHEPDTVVVKGSTSFGLKAKPGAEGLLSMVKVDEAYLWVQVSVRDAQNQLIGRGSTMGDQVVVRAEGTDPFGDGGLPPPVPSVVVGPSSD